MFDKHHAIKALQPEEANYESAEVIRNQFDEWKTTVSENQKENGLNPPKVKISSLSREGKMTIKFNQEMFAPNFDLSENSTTSKRKLAMSRMNVQRDLLDITVLQQVS